MIGLPATGLGWPVEKWLPFFIVKVMVNDIRGRAAVALPVAALALPAAVPTSATPAISATPVWTNLFI
jgi:hypothetical protein